MNTTGSSSSGVHLHFEIRQKVDAYTASSGWYAGTTVNPAVFFPDLLTATNFLSQSGYYFDSDPTATENTFSEAVYIIHNGQKFDVRWIAGMSESEREMYDITDNIIEDALMAVVGNSAYTEIEMKLATIK